MCGGSQDEADFHQVRFVFILLAYNEKNADVRLDAPWSIQPTYPFAKIATAQLEKMLSSCYSSHGVVHPAARRPANKVTFTIISSPSPKAT